MEKAKFGKEKGKLFFLESHLDQLHKATQQATAQYSTSAFPPKNKGPPIPPLRGFSGFLAAFAKEVRQDLGLLTK